MKHTIQLVRIGLVALLIATLSPSLLAAPPHTGIQGQAFLFYPGFAVEVEPGVWLGVGGFTIPIATSFTVLSAHSERQIGSFATDTDGSFEISLPPGKYIVVPDTSPWVSPMTSSFEVTVRPKHFTDASVYYVSSPFIFTPASP